MRHVLIFLLPQKSKRNNFLLSLPWDQSTISGYLSEMFFGFNIGEGYLFINGTILLLFMSMCMHHRAFYKMFKHLTDQWNRPHRSIDEKMFLCHLIRFHISVKE